MFDLIIRNAKLVDGTGAPAREADIAIKDGLIAEIGTIGSIEGTATTEIDARGDLVTPGWVDIHTHYDGQVTWDPYLLPSGWNGVTTAVMGNCGVGFAPAKPDSHDWLIGLMEGVEDIPGAALAEGITLGLGDISRISRCAGQAAARARCCHADPPWRGSRLCHGRTRRQ